MRKLIVAVAALLFSPLATAGTTISPTTTLAAETSNNTSASSSFTTLSDGDIAPGNVSKVPLRTLLYSGNNSGIYVHFMPWFGSTNHMNVGYNSADPNQVHRQVTDMLSRGIAGALIDWYGPSSARENNTSIYMMQDAETRGGQFFFAINFDGGALKSCASTAGCDVTQTMIDDLNYVYTEFESSPSYLRVNGRPVISFFSTDTYTLDWNAIRAGVQGNPLFIFRNSGAFTHIQSDGGFSWVGISSSTDSMGLAYMDNYYNTALKYPAEYTFGSGYKGFNDTLASWGKNRIVTQQCGQTWLQTIADANKHYSSTNQLDAIQLVTWNDYEEGTEFETGIDNCVAISAAMSGSQITWSITGDETTLDHYTVFISLDGQNLMPLADVPAGTHALSLASYGLAAGNYVLYVKAVGKPSLLNHMSAAVNYSIVVKKPHGQLRLLPSIGVAPATMTASTAGSTGTLTSASIDFGDGTVSSVTPGSSLAHKYAQPGSYTVTLTVTDSTGATATTKTLATVQSPFVAIAAPAQHIVRSPVSVIASGHSGNPLTAMKIYVDNVSMFSVSAGSLASSLPLPAGPHRIVVRAWDSSGASFSSVVNVNVVSAPAAPHSANSFATSSVRGAQSAAFRRSPPRLFRDQR